MRSKLVVFVFDKGLFFMSKRAKKSRDSGSSTKRSRSKGPGGGVKAMDYAYIAPRAPPRMHGPEKKAVDDPVAAYEFNQTGTIGHIGGCAPGAGRWQRVGRKVNYRSVHVKGTIYLQGANAGTVNNEYARLILVYDRQPNGSAPSIGDVLQDIDSAGTSVTNSFSGLNLNNSQRFLILRDGRFNLPGNALAQAMCITSTNSEDPADINWFVKLKDLPCEYKGDTAGIASVSSGALYLLSISDQPVVNKSWKANIAVRTRYVDY